MALDEDIQIYLAARDDIPAILEISNFAALHTYANFATEPEPLSAWLAAYDATHRSYPWIVAKQSAKTIGFAKASPHRSRGAYAWISEVSVYVTPDFHRRGVGRSLYERLISTMLAQGYVTLVAVITPPNPGSIALHEASGFQRCGTFRKAGWKFGRWFDVGYWDLVLDPSGEAPGPIRPVAEVWT